MSPAPGTTDPILNLKSYGSFEVGCGFKSVAFFPLHGGRVGRREGGAGAHEAAVVEHVVAHHAARQAAALHELVVERPLRHESAIAHGAGGWELGWAGPRLRSLLARVVAMGGHLPWQHASHVTARVHTEFEARRQYTWCDSAPKSYVNVVCPAPYLDDTRDT